MTPGPASRLRGWLGGSPRSQRRVGLRVATVAGLIMATLALGTWGFATLTLARAHGSTPALKLSLLESFYRALKLYALDIGPAGGGYASGPNWQILLALGLAVLLVLRALLALVGERLRRLAARRMLHGHVIICGAGVHGARFARELSGDHDVVVLDIDAAAPGLRTDRGPHEWRLVGDAVQAGALLAAGAPRASTLIAVTGDDFVNSQIVSAVHALGRVRDRLHVLVQVEDPSLARFLEEEPGAVPSAGAPAPAPRPSPIVTPFSANAIAAQSLLVALRCKVDADLVPLLELPDNRAPHLILAGDHPLLDAIALAALRRWRMLTLRALEQRSGALRPPFRISVYGSGAVERIERIRRRWRPESSVLELEAKDVDLAGETQIEQDDWLRDRDVAGHAVIACLRELDGVRLTLAISRALGDGVRMTRVTTQPESVLDQRLRDQTARSSWLATTEVRALADLACDRRAIGYAASRHRLEAALGPALGADAARAVSAQLFARTSLRIHSDTAWRVPAPERVLLEPLLAPAPVSAFVEAGLSVDLEEPENLWLAADGLIRRGAPADETFMAWCEYARHVAVDAPAPVRAGLERVVGDEVADAILRLRRHTLAAAAPAPAPGPFAGAERITILSGAADTLTSEQRSLLGPLLRRALAGYQGVLLSGGTAAGLPGLVGEVARDLDLTAIGYAPTGRGDSRLYPTLRESGSDGEFSVREPLAMWSDIVAAGFNPADVRVVACPGGPITDAEVLLARALEARVVWLDPAGDAVLPLDDALPFGADGVLEIPADAMTLRAFVCWPTASDRLPGELRDQLARHFHAAYRRNQRGRKRAGDPAMAPWDELLPVLQRSNLALADDIPVKLALVGRSLARPGSRLRLREDELELLAEAEHGRYNIERLQGGWQIGDRQLLRRVSPFLRPWDELSDEAKEYDREAVRAIDSALAAAGWGVRET